MSDMVNVHAKYWKMIGDLDRDKTELRERIKQLEKELMEVKNKHSVLIADVVLDEDRAERIKRLEEAGDAMADMMIRSARIIERESPSALAWLRAKEDKL